MLMEIKKAIINNKLVGYYFYFSKLLPYEISYLISYTTKDDNDNNKDEEMKNIVKYKTMIKHPQLFVNPKETKKISKSFINKNKKETNNGENVKNIATYNSSLSISDKI